MNADNAKTAGLDSQTPSSVIICVNLWFHFP